jgi:hypothetical protein
MAKTYNTLGTVAPGDVLRANSGTAAYNGVITNVNNYRVPPMCRVHRAAALSHTSNGNFQAISFDTETFTQTDSGMWAVGTPTRITIQTAGLYLITGSFELANNATGVRGGDLILNGTTRLSYSFVTASNGSFGSAFALAATYSLAVGNYVEMRAYQNSGGNLAYGTQDTGQFFHLSATWLGQVS